MAIEIKQTTIGEIIENERTMVLRAPETYGNYYIHALETSAFLTKFIKSIDPGYDTLVAFLALAKKHHLLAVFSTVRLHKIQAMMNLRQVLEAGASAAFATHNPDPSHFVDTDAMGLLSASQSLTKARYQWLDKTFPDGSCSIKKMKDQINESTAHANLIYAQSNFRRAENAKQFEAPYFDIEDAYIVKADLWLIGKIAITCLDLLYGANAKKRVIKLIDDFSARFDVLLKQNRTLHDEITATDRYKRAKAIARH